MKACHESRSSDAAITARRLRSANGSPSAPQQTGEALDHWRRVFRRTEAVLLSTCNRVEIYAAGEAANAPAASKWPASWPASIASIRPRWRRICINTCGEEAVRHLFTVAASLDSMVVGEPQILAQVKQAYQAAVAARQRRAAAALGLSGGGARRPPRGHETTIHQRRVSIPSVAVADFAQQIFERFDDKRTLRDRRRRNGRRDAALSAATRAPADHGRQSAIRARRANWPGAGAARRGLGKNCRRRSPRPTWSSAPPAPASRSSPCAVSARSRRRGRAAAVCARPGRAARFRAGHRRPARRLSLFDRRPAGGLPAEPRRSATRNCRPPCGSSSRRPSGSWATSIIAPPAR